jgi:hypothetical protein
VLFAAHFRRLGISPDDPTAHISHPLLKRAQHPDEISTAYMMQ